MWAGTSAADAWAAGDRAGIGGWWNPQPDGPWWTVYWFRLEISASELQEWAHLRGDLQREIAWFELLAQVTLLVLKCRCMGNRLTGLCSLQLCDNSATVGACTYFVFKPPDRCLIHWFSGKKLLSTASPMCLGLQALAYWSHHLTHQVRNFPPSFSGWVTSDT